MPIPTDVFNTVRAKLLTDLDQWSEKQPNGGYSAREVIQDFTRHLYQHYHWREEPWRKATVQEVEQALLAYKEGVLGRRLFDGATDAQQVQMALALQGLNANTTGVIDVALKLGLC